MANRTDKRLFRLGGKEYAISKSYVEERMKGSLPKEVGKYAVLVAGENFPPKQVIAQSLGIGLVSFTTMDASRILTALGFEVLRVDEKRQPPKNESELLFEQYMATSGLFDFQFEQEFPGKNRLPDYVVSLADESKIFFEVKEFRATLEDFRSGGGAYDPYARIREKIQQGRDKFKPFKDSRCCLVLFNREKPLVDLRWQFIYGAMLGNIAFRIPFNPETGVHDSSLGMQQTFATGGEMLRYKGLQPIEPQNRTISAIMTLDLLPVGRIRFEQHIEQVEQKRKLVGKPELAVEEFLQILDACRGTDRDYSLTQLRGVVHENPYARPGTEFPVDLFRGPYDERYGGKDGRIQRLFAGPGILSLEEQGWKQDVF